MAARAESVELPSFPPPKRKVQWIGLNDDEEELHEHDSDIRRAAEGISHDGHTSVPMGSPADPGGSADYFSGASSGTNTPEPFSEVATPEVSRPATPDFHDDPSVDIISGERDGLPTSTTAQRSFGREAAKLVGTHKAKERFRALGRRQHGEGGVDAAAVAAALRADMARAEVIEDAPVQSGISPVRSKGRGVLSSLLKLYDHPSTASSQVTLVDPSPPRPPRPTPALRSSFDGLGHALRSAGRNAGDTIARVTPFVDYAERPAQARSSGGVFGALQAGALDLAGPAAPLSTTVRPAPGRSGFRVNRHGIEEPEKREQHSPPSSSGTTTPGGLGSRPGQKSSHLSLQHFGEKFTASAFYNESNVLKAARANSTPSTPQTEYAEKPKLSRRRKKKQDEIYITMHVAAILQRQDFVLRLARALMMFGAPSHRLESQIQATARTLDIQCQVIFLVNFAIISFQDDETHTSDIRFIKQSAALDLDRLTQLVTIHYEVTHDLIGVQEASVELSKLMRRPALYNKATNVLIGGLASAFIAPAAFNASFIDVLISFGLGCILVIIQLWVAAKSDVLGSLFEILVVTIVSFVSAALASTKLFCYSAITSASIVLVLPGWPVCVAALELQSRSIVCGSVRLVYAFFYSLLLGFSLSIGATIWSIASSQDVVSAGDGSCSFSHVQQAGGSPVSWYRQTISLWFAFLCVPGFALILALRNGANVKAKEVPIMVLIASGGWTVSHFASLAFPARADITSALSAFAIGCLALGYGKLSRGLSYVVAVPPVLFQLPSGLGNGGLLNYASNTDSQNVLGNAFGVAQQLISVALGVVIGLFAATAVFYPFGKRRTGLMSF